MMFPAAHSRHPRPQPRPQPRPCHPHSAEAFIRRFLARVPPEIAATFSPDQLAAVQRAFGMRYAAEHAVDVRRSVPLPWGRYYLVLLAGRDRPGEASARWFAAAFLVTLALTAALAWLRLG
jgi:hypothetical protein